MQSLSLRRDVVTFDKKVGIKPFEKHGDISNVSEDGTRLTITITGSIDEFLKELAKHTVIDLDEQETTLEDIFMNYYEVKNA